MGKGGGGGQPTQSNVTNTNVPEYARPYVENMLGATQQQLFKMDGNNITGFQPYKAYGGTYDASGNQTSYDPSKTIAGFSPLQQQAQQGIAGMRMPGGFGAAASATQNATQQALNANYASSNYDSQFKPQGLEYLAQNAQAANLGYAPTVSAQDLQYFQMGPAERVNAQNVNAQNINAAQMGPAERVTTQSFAQPGSADAYMSPYMQSVVDIQKREAQRQSGIQGTQQQAQAAQAGAFGGGRDAIMRAERERNLSQQMGDIQAQGSQAAYQQAQQQFNAEQQARLAAQQSNQQAGLTVGTQNLSAQQQANVQNAANQLQASGMNAQQAMQAALANQQAGLTVGQQNLGANLSVQQQGAQIALANQQTQSQYGLQQGQFTQQANLANQAAQNQAGQFNAGQNLQAAGMGAQYGQAANQLNEQSRQYGAGYGMQGLQTGLQGANQLANISNQGLQAQQGIYGLQNQVGQQQQQQQQQIINQSMQDYANAQQYPLMQLGTMSNMLRGLPMQAQTTQQYQAQANPITQGIGAIGALGSLAQMKAKGGAVKSMASGGITSVPRYDVGGEVMSQLATMPDEALRKEATESPSPKVREMAVAILKQRQAGMDARPQMSAAPEGVGPMGVDYNAGYAGGGIIAFADGKKVDAEEAARNAKQTEMYVLGAKLAAANQPASQGIPPLLDRNAPAFTPNTTRGSSTAKVIPTVPEEYVPDVIASPRGGVKLDLSDRDKNPLKDKTFGSKEEALAAYRNSINASASIPVLQKRTVPVAPEALPPLTDAQRQAMIAGAQKAIQEGRKSGVLTASPATVVAPKTAIKTVPQAAPQVAQEATSAVPPPPALLDRNAPAYTGSAVEAAPTGIAAATAPAVDPLADIRLAAKNAQANADKTQEQIYKENLAALKAQGLDTSEARDQYLKSQQAQRADTENAFKNREYLRRAEFFASWGSTPGNTLVAGMTALKKTIPDMIQDTTDKRAALQQADKAIYELGEATRLEKLGQWEKAAAQKLKAAETAADLQEKLATATANIEGQKISAGATMGAAELRAKTDEKVQGMRDVIDKLKIESDAATLRQARQLAAQARSDDIKGRTDTANQEAYRRAQEFGAIVESRIDNIMKTPSFEQLRQTASMPESSTNKSIIDSAKKALKDYETSFAAQRKAADDAMKQAALRAGITPSAATDSAPVVDPAALAWARDPKNANDPRLPAIKAKLGLK